MRRFASLIFLLVASCEVAFAVSVVPAPDLSRLVGSVVPKVVFEDDLGRSRDMSRFEGQPLIVLPVYAHCHGSCSQLASHLKRAIVRSALDPRTFQVFVFSFDPEDSIEGLREFRTKLQLPASWTLGHLKQDQIVRLTSALDYKTAREGDEWIHPDVAVILRSNLSISKILKGPNFTEGQIKEGIATSSKIENWMLHYGPYLFAFSAMTLIFSSILIAAHFASKRKKESHPTLRLSLRE